jgi:hypothetical protein
MSQHYIVQTNMYAEMSRIALQLSANRQDAWNEMKAQVGSGSLLGNMYLGLAVFGSLHSGGSGSGVAPDGGDGEGASSGTQDEITSQDLRKVFFSSFKEWYSNLDGSDFSFTNVNDLALHIISSATLFADQKFSDFFPELMSEFAVISYIDVRWYEVDENGEIIRDEKGFYVENRFTIGFLTNDEYPYFSYVSSWGAPYGYGFSPAIVNSSGQEYGVQFQWIIAPSYTGF